ncbi:MAG TPA: hypothetical protein VEK79_18865 [Thermoanaerobaculia bacterium]|nr:hypothetical protein [Thermoanaerobaculia bacterium]
MDLSSTHVHYPPSYTLPVLFCVLWTFIVLALLTRRGRSAGPVAAALVPLALFTAATCVGLINTTRGMAISGSGGRASVAAGIAESFGALYAAAFFMATVAVFAAIRLHRPFADRLTATLFAVLMIDIVAARVAAGTLAQMTWQSYVAAAGVITALLIAIIAVVWTVLVGRGRVNSRALPYGITIMLAVAVIAGVMVWQTIQQYRAIAMYG